MCVCVTLWQLSPGCYPVSNVYGTSHCGTYICLYVTLSTWLQMCLQSEWPFYYY